MLCLARVPRRAISLISRLPRTQHHLDVQYLQRQAPQRKLFLPPSYRFISSVSSRVVSMAHDEPLVPGATIQGYSGRIYTIEETLAERRSPLLCVYRARYKPECSLFKPICCALLTRYSAEGKKFVVKNMIPDDYEYQKDLQGSIASCPHLRTMVDGVPGPDLFIYPFLKTNLLQFSQNKLSNATRKDILKSALTGLAALHEKNIIHSGNLEPLLYLNFLEPRIQRTPLTRSNRYQARQHSIGL
ncbi:hypothetical protein ONS96_009387 [Cadophora gregata f. sp. sojae]|nr:hypothetical protein ONS96_009387 [Cadophora gregata f. sp. sojae]